MKPKEKVFWRLVTSEAWQIHLAATRQGLCYLGSPGASFNALTKWIEKRIPDHELFEDQNELEPYQAQLLEYFAQKRTKFSLPLDLRGTEFQLTVWEELMNVGFGRNATYTELAEKIQRPDAIRAVGTAVGANPILIIVPCHRILGKNGELRGYRGGLEMKKQLLELEQSY